jgi:hypothetical protein
MLFLRLCKVVIGKENNPLFSWDQSFRITFDITKNLLESAKSSKIEIYNLSRTSQNSLKDIIKQNQDSSGESQLLVSVYAGYQQDAGLELLYKGNVVSIYTRKEPANIITTIMCSELMSNTYSSASYGNGIDTNDVVADYIHKLNKTIDDASDLSGHTKLAHGFSHVGLAKEGLKKIVAQTGSTHTIEDQKIKIIPIGKSSKNITVNVNVDSGMIYSPEKLETKGTECDTPKEKNGWKIRMLLQPKIKLGGKINVTSIPINGIFIADSIEHKGDTKGGDWETTIETKTENT